MSHAAQYSRYLFEVRFVMVCPFSCVGGIYIMCFVFFLLEEGMFFDCPESCGRERLGVFLHCGFQGTFFPLSMNLLDSLDDKYQKLSSHLANT